MGFKHSSPVCFSLVLFNLLKSKSNWIRCVWRTMGISVTLRPLFLLTFSLCHITYTASVLLFSCISVNLKLYLSQKNLLEMNVYCTVIPKYVTSIYLNDFRWYAYNCNLTLCLIQPVYHGRCDASQWETGGDIVLIEPCCLLFVHGAFRCWVLYQVPVITVALVWQPLWATEHVWSGVSISVRLQYILLNFLSLGINYTHSFRNFWEKFYARVLQDNLHYKW